MSSAGIETPEGASSLVVRESGSEVISSASFAMESAADAETEKASLLLSFHLAGLHPRKLEVVREGLLAAARRPLFAEKAMYHLPVGAKGIHGMSIRFVETAIQLMGNLRCTQKITYDDATRRKIMVRVMDCETGAMHETEVIVSKTVERRSQRTGKDALPPIRERFNSYGDKLYEYEATDDEMANKAASACSKALRTTGLRLIPADLVEESRLLIEATAKSTVQGDPDAWKKIADAFSQLHVPIEQLTAYLGNTLASAQPTQITELRALFEAIKDDATTWADAMAMRDAERAADHGEGEGEAGDEVGAKAEGLRGNIRDRIKKQKDKSRGAKDDSADPAKPPPAKDDKKGKPGKDEKG